MTQHYAVRIYMTSFGPSIGTVARSASTMRIPWRATESTAEHEYLVPDVIDLSDNGPSWQVENVLIALDVQHFRDINCAENE
jgi:hypothetical protein